MNPGPKILLFPPVLKETFFLPLGSRLFSYAKGERTPSIKLCQRRMSAESSRKVLRRRMFAHQMTRVDVGSVQYNGRE